MAPLKQLDDAAELAVALDLRRRGYGVAFPFGEDCDYDLVVDRGRRLELGLRVAPARNGQRHSIRNAVDNAAI